MITDYADRAYLTGYKQRKRKTQASVVLKLLAGVVSGVCTAALLYSALFILFILGA